jgi:transposase
MNIIGCDLHPRYQVVARVNQGEGEITRRRLEHENGEAEAFYRGLPPGAIVGIEASLPLLWFERLLAECGHELWVGDAAQIRAQRVRQQKTDTRDAEHLLDLLLTKRFPRLWIPSPGERDLRQLLVHRDKLVRMRTAVKNQLQAMAMGQGICQRWKLWSAQGRAQLTSLELLPWAGRRRQDLLEWLDELDRTVDELDRALEEAGRQRPEVVRLQTHPGVGPVVSMAFVLTLGPVERFRRSRQVVSYLGLNPQEHSSGDRQRFGPISKQGNRMMRWLLVDAAQSAARWDRELRRDYQRWKYRKASGVAKVAIARKLAVRLYWMLRQQMDYAQLVGTSGSPSSGVVDKQRGPSGE